MVTGLSTGAPVKALRWGTGEGGHLTCAPAVSRLALAAEGPMGVQAEATVEAHAGLAALVNVIAAVLSLEARWAGAVVVVIPIGTTGPVGTGACGTGINEGAVLAWRLNSELNSVNMGTFNLRSDLSNEDKSDRCTSEPSLAHTGVLWDTIDHLALASCSVQTWRSMTGIQELTERTDESRATSGQTTHTFIH